MPAVPEHLTPKFFVDEAISHSMDESSLSKLDPDEELELVEQESLILFSNLTSAQTTMEIPTKTYVDGNNRIGKIYHQYLTIKIFNFLTIF